MEGEILDTCRELGISLVPYSPLARGIITATLNGNNSLAKDDWRRSVPRFDEAHWENNQKLVDEFAAIAKEKDCTPAQLALAWVLAQGEDVIPIPGTKKRKYLEENAKAVDIILDGNDFISIETVLEKYPNVGQRISDANMKLVNK